MSIWRAFSLAMGQMGDPRFLRVILLGVAFAAIIMIAFTALFAQLILWSVGDGVDLPIFGTVTWLGDFLSWGAVATMMILSIFLMLPLSTAISAFFLDAVSAAVEDRHYAHLPPAHPASFGDMLRDMINFWGVLIAANLCAIVLYFIFIPFAALIFWGVNGLILGREYFAMAALRRMDVQQMRRLRKKHAAAIWGSGAILAIPMTIPVVNLFVPVLALAVFTHHISWAMDQAFSRSNY